MVVAYAPNCTPFVDIQFMGCNGLTIAALQDSTNSTTRSGPFDRRVCGVRLRIDRAKASWFILFAHPKLRRPFVDERWPDSIGEPLRVGPAVVRDEQIRGVKAGLTARSGLAQEQFVDIAVRAEARDQQVGDQEHHAAEQPAHGQQQAEG